MKQTELETKKPKTLSKSPTIQSEVLNIRQEVFKLVDLKALLLTNQVTSLKKSVFFITGLMFETEPTRQRKQNKTLSK